MPVHDNDNKNRYLITYKLILHTLPGSVAMIVSQDASGITEPSPHHKMWSVILYAEIQVGLGNRKHMYFFMTLLVHKSTINMG